MSMNFNFCDTLLRCVVRDDMTTLRVENVQRKKLDSKHPMLFS